MAIAAFAMALDRLTVAARPDRQLTDTQAVASFGTREILRSSNDACGAGRTAADAFFSPDDQPCLEGAADTRCVRSEVRSSGFLWRPDSPDRANCQEQDATRGRA